MSLSVGTRILPPHNLIFTSK